MGELVLKLQVVELLAFLATERDRHRYALEYRLVRADSLGEWSKVLDEILQGPASQHLLVSARDSHRSATALFPPGDTAWQRLAVEHLIAACDLAGTTTDVSLNGRLGLRQWATSFVALRNSTRGHGAPLPSVLANAAAHLRQSIDLLLDNAPAFSRPWGYVRRQLNGRPRVSYLGGDDAPFRNLTTDDVSGLADGVYVHDGQLARVPLLFSDPEVLDFYLPNGSYKGGKFEVLSYITGLKRREEGAHWTHSVETLPPSETSATEELEVVGDSLGNIPPRPDGYVPRPKLEADLLALLESSRHSVVTLQGRGGVGKTSLALQVLHDVAGHGTFGVIAWFSARDIDLLPEGPKVVRADVLTRDEMAHDFATLLGRDLRTKEALTLMSEALGDQGALGGPFLFVFDNFETVRDPSDLYEFVSNSIRPPNKALITTRTRSFKGDYPVEVRGMERDEFAQLVSEVSIRLGISELIDKGFKEELYHRSDAHPYVAKVILGEIALRRKKLSIDRAVANNDSMLNALFERSFAGLAPAAQRVFLTLCSWRSLVPRIGLEAVFAQSTVAQVDAESAVDELVQTSLVEQLDEDPEALFLSVPLAASIFGRQKLVTSPLTHTIEVDLEYVRAFGVVREVEAKRGLSPVVERLAQEISKRAAHKAFRDQGIAVLEYIANSYPPAWRDLARLHREIGSDAHAIEAHRRYLERVADDAEAWAELVRLYRSVRDWPMELNARIQYAEIPNLPFDDLMESAARLNYVISRKEVEWDAQLRKRSIERFRDLIEERYKEADATDLSRLAWLCLHLQDLDGARRWAELGLELEPSNAYCISLLDRLRDQGRKRGKGRAR